MLLKIIRPQYGLNQIDVGRQDPVFIQIGDPLQTLLNVCPNRFQGPGPFILQARIKAGLEQADDSLNHVGVPGKCLNDVVLAVSKADLFEVPVSGPQKGGLLPVELCSERQSIEAIIVCLSLPDSSKQSLKVRLALSDLDVALVMVGKIKNMQKDCPAACTLDSKRVFRQYVEPEVFDDGQYIRQHHGTLRGIQSQLCLVGGISWWLLKRNLELCLSICLCNVNKMIKPLGRGEVLAKGGGKRLCPFIGQRKAFPISMMILQQMTKLIGPGAR